MYVACGSKAEVRHRALRLGGDRVIEQVLGESERDDVVGNRGRIGPGALELVLRVGDEAGAADAAHRAGEDAAAVLRLDGVELAAADALHEGAQVGLKRLGGEELPGPWRSRRGAGRARRERCLSRSGVGRSGGLRMRPKLGVRDHVRLRRGHAEPECEGADGSSPMTPRDARALPARSRPRAGGVRGLRGRSGRERRLDPDRRHRTAFR